MHRPRVSRTSRPSAVPSPRHLPRVVAAIALLALTLAACGGDTGQASPSSPSAPADPATPTTPTTPSEEPPAPAELRDVLVRAGFYFNASAEAVFLAQDEGFFAEEGLNVEIREGNGSGAVIQLIGAGGDAEIGWSIDSGTAALNISQGVPIKIAQISKRVSPFGTSCHAHVDFSEPQDLVGPSVLVVPGESTAAIFPAYLAINGLDEDDITIVNSDAPVKVQLFASGQADCMIGYASGDNLQASIVNPDIPPAIPWSDHGVSIMGDGVVVASALWDSEPEVVEGFLRAVNRGFEMMCTDVEASVERYNDRFRDMATDADREYISLTMPRECTDVVSEDGIPFAEVADEDWDTMIQILADYGGLDPVLPREDYLLDGLDKGEVSW